MALSKVERAHQMYRDGRYDEALGFYTDALSMAKTKAQKIALHSNRAACFLKLNHFKKATDECTSVLELDLDHTGALMLRAQTLVTLKEYQSALFDVNRLLELNPSSEVYLNLQSRLKTQLSLAPIPEAETELEETDEDTSEEMFERDEQLEAREGEKVDECKVTDSVEKESNTDTVSGSIERTQAKVNSSNGFFTPASNGSHQSFEPHSKGQQVIPKPKGHSRLDYSRWDTVADGSSDDEDEDEETWPRYRFRVKGVDVRPVK